MFESEALPDVMPYNLCQRLHVVPYETRKMIDMVNNGEAQVVAEVSIIPINIGQ